MPKVRHPPSSVSMTSGSSVRDKKAAPVWDMAARLFAELFYKQVMAERHSKPRQASDTTIDNWLKEDVGSNHVIQKHSRR
jgi:hypothetical protein